MDRGIDTRIVGTTPIQFTNFAGFAVKNLGAYTVSYGSTTAVSDGTIAPGGTTSFTEAAFFRASAQNLVQIDYQTADEELDGVDITDLEARVDALEASIVVVDEAITLKQYGCEGDGSTDDTTAFNAALTAAENATGSGGKIIGEPGSYLLDGDINFDQFVSFEGAGARECIFELNDASTKLIFNEYGGPTNTRGGRISGFHVDGNGLATNCVDVQLAVNRTFSDFRISNIGANGIGLLVEGAQNCNFKNFDIEAQTAASTTGIKVTDSAGSCRFSEYSILECGYAGIWVTQTNSGAQFGVGYPEPRYCSFDDGIIEHGDPTTACALRIHSGRDLYFSKQQFFVATDQASSGPYTVVEINDGGAGVTRQIFFDRGQASGGSVSDQLNGGITLPQATITVDSTSGFGNSGTFTVGGQTVTYTGKTSTTFTGCTGGAGAVADNATVTQKESTAFDVQSGAASYYTRITNWQFGNNRYGVIAASGQTVEVEAHNNTSTDTLFSGAGTIVYRAFGSTTFT